MASVGYVYEESASGAEMDVAVRTGDRSGQKILQQKNLLYIYYDMNTHDKDVTLTVYIDDTAQTPTFTINTSSREQDRIEDIPEEWAGYVFDARLTATDLTDDDLEIYAPLVFEYTPFGV